ncbi:MAG: O-antigen ligase family protein [Elusimicrobiota bacterium]|jgi:O-antigen ligase/Flp pilus assembly protein TadD|nr:O-antigen ligase family protein [Elusimicrobiota bacterium]
MKKANLNNGGLPAVADKAYKFFLSVCIFVSPLLFFTDFTRNPYEAQSLVLTLACAGMLVSWAVGVFVRKEIVFKYSAADILFLCFICFALLSLGANALFSHSRVALISEFLRRGQTLFTNAFAAWLAAKYLSVYDGKKQDDFIGLPLLVWACAWLFFPVLKMRGMFDVYALILWGCGVFICLKRMRENNVAEIFDIFIAISALGALYGIMQNVGFDIFWNINISGQFGDRAISTFGNPNFLSSYIALFTPLVFVYFVNSQNKTGASYYFAIMILQAVYLAISQTRSSWIGVFAGFAVLFAFGDLRRLFWRRKKRFFSILLCAAAFFFLWPASRSGEKYSSAALSRAGESGFISSLSDLTLDARPEKINRSYHQRLMMWTCALEIAKEKPILGGGWGSYQLNYAPCQGSILSSRPQLSQLRTQANSAHNEFMEVLAQSGFGGLFLYLSFYLLLIYLFLKNYGNLNQPSRLFYGAALAGAAAFLADNMFNITTQTGITSFAFWFVLASLNALFCKTKIKKAGVLRAAFLAALCVAFSFALCFWQCARFKSQYYEFKAHKSLAAGNGENAASFAKQSLNSISKSAEAFYTLINAYFKLNDMQNAAEVSREAIKYAPHYHEFYFRLSSAAHKLGDDREAVLNLFKVLKLYPSYYPAAQSYAGILAKGGAAPSADDISLLEELKRIFYFSGEIRLAAAKVYAAYGDLNSARDTAARVLGEDNIDPDAYILLEDLNRKLDIKDDPLLQKAAVAVKLKNDLKAGGVPAVSAGDEIKKFAANYPGDLSAAMLLAEFDFRNGRIEQAVSTLENIYEENKGNAALNFALASSYAALKDNKKAVFYLGRILALNPFNSVARSRLAAFNSQSG